jgi:cell division protein FtsL
MNIVRFLNIVAVAALIAAAVFVYRIKYEATWRGEEVAKLERAIARERSQIAILKAEWASLDRPDRIQRLAQKNLGLMPPDPHQRVSVASLPMRPARVDAIANTIASLKLDDPIAMAPKDDPIARTIEALGLAGSSADRREARAAAAVAKRGVR